MRVVYYLDSVSEHQMPVAKHIVRDVGALNFRYFYINDRALHRKRMMGKDPDFYEWTLPVAGNEAQFEEWIENADVLYTIYRLPDLFSRRAAHGLLTLYASERWFKPIPLLGLRWLLVPGKLRLCSVRYLRMALRMRRLILSKRIRYLPIGLHAARDMCWLCGYPVPERCDIGCDPVLGGSALRMWGYFVEPSKRSRHELTELRERQRTQLLRGERPLRVLWVGRYLPLKNVDVLVDAVKIVHCAGIPVSLDLYGEGPSLPEIERRRKDAESIVSLHQPVPIWQVREMMQDHDVYVFPSNGQEGWGAVVSEALEEQMLVGCSRQAGAGVTLLPQTCLFDGKSAKEIAAFLIRVYRGDEKKVVPPWSAVSASAEMMRMIHEWFNSEEKSDA